MADRRSSRDATAERVLRFPPDRSLGVISVKPHGTALDAAGQALATARWSVLVPAGMDVRLLVDPEAASMGLTALDGLPADGLCDLVLLDCPVDDGDMVHLHGLTGLRLLDLFRTRVTDDATRVVAELSCLEWLSFTGTQVGDEGVERLVTLGALRRLSLKYTDVTDRAMLALTTLPQLRWLSLTGTRITDQGLHALLDAPSLETLSITGTSVTADAVATWWRERPEVRLVAH